MADNDKMESSGGPKELGGQPEQAAGTTPGKRHTFDSGCPKCGALLPTGSGACLVCGTERGERPYEGAFPAQTGGAERPRLTAPDRLAAQEARAAPGRWRRWFGGVSCAIVVLVGVLAGLGVYRQYFDTGSFRANEAVVYQNSDGALMLSHPGLEEPIAVTGAIAPASDFSGGHVAVSPNGRWMACADTTGALYRIDLAQGEAVAVLVTGDYGRGAVFSQNSEYLVFISETGELYVGDQTDRRRLDTGVAAILAVDNNKVLYTRRGDEMDEVDLYLNDLRPSGGGWLLIDREVTGILDWTGGFEKILYTTRQYGEDGEPVNSLKSFQQGEAGGSTMDTLATGIGHVLDASAERGVALYLTPDTLGWGYEQFVDDDMAARDAAVRAPDIEDYPLVAEAFALYGEGGEFIDLADNEELLEQLTEYRELQQSWEDKLTRDALRKHLRETFDGVENPVELGDLYVYQNGGSVRLDSGVWDTGDLTVESGHVSAEGGFIIYEKIHPDTLHKIPMSALWEDAGENMPEPVEYFLSGTSRELLFSRLAGEPMRVFLRTDSNAFRQWRVTRNADGVYFTTGPAGAVDTTADTLYYTALAGAEPADLVQVERAVSWIEGPLQNGVLFWVGEEEEAQLYFAQNGSAQYLAGADTSPAVPVDNGNTLLYLEWRSSARATGDLYLFGQEQTLVAGGVGDYLYRSDDLIYLLRGGQSTTTWDLYVWQGGRESLVARDVSLLADR